MKSHPLAFFVFCSFLLGNSSHCFPQDISSEPVSGIYKVFQDAYKQFGDSGDPEILSNLAEYLRTHRSSLTENEFDRGVGTLLAMDSRAANFNINETLKVMEGIQHRSIAGLGISLRNKEGIVGIAANQLLATIPEGIVAYFVTSIDGARWNQEVLWRLGDEGVDLLVDRMIAEESPPAQTRTLLVLTAALRHHDKALEQKTHERAIRELVATVLSADDKQIIFQLRSLNGINEARILKLADSIAESDRGQDIQNTASSLLGRLKNTAASPKPIR